MAAAKKASVAIAIAACSAVAIFFAREPSGEEGTPSGAVFEAASPPRPQEPVAEHGRQPPPSFSNATALSGEGRAPPGECAQLDALVDNWDAQRSLLEARRLLGHGDVQVRRHVAGVLDWIGTHALFDLAEMMTDPDAMVAQTAEEAFWAHLEALEDNRIKLQLLGILFDSAEPSIRIGAIEQLGSLPPAYSFATVMEGLKDQDPGVRLAARDNLWFLSGGKDFTTYDQWNAWFAEHSQDFVEEELSSSEDGN